MWKYAATLAYDGTGYCGWQKQKGAAAAGSPSIQETVENVLLKLTSEEKVSLVGSGRTDAGVHALGQVIHFTVRRKQWDSKILQKGMNSLLPQAIQAREVWPVAEEFHAQRSASKKQYSYYFQQGSCAIPHLQPFSWWIKKRLNLEAMNEALGHLTGEHDFKAFQAAGAKPGPTVRKILEAEAVMESLSFPARGLVLPPGADVGLVRVRLIGTGFLKQMVRGIAGTLLQVGENRRDPGCFREILDSRNRTLVGPTAPARALWLEKVWYGECDER